MFNSLTIIKASHLSNYIKGLQKAKYFCRIMDFARSHGRAFFQVKRAKIERVICQNKVKHIFGHISANIGRIWKRLWAVRWIRLPHGLHPCLGIASKLILWIGMPKKARLEHFKRWKCRKSFASYQIAKSEKFSISLDWLICRKFISWVKT